MVPQAKRVDFHLHTCRSDGRFTPDEVLARCARAGLEVVALTDHDLASDVAGEVHYEGRPIHVVPGAEVSGMHAGHEYHLLVYFPNGVPAAFRDFCAEQVRARVERYANAVRNLGLPNLAPPGEEAIRGDVALTRHHLARALVAAGHARDMRDAFARFAGESTKHVPAVPMQFLDAIASARRCGGLTSWAHPPLLALEKHLGVFVEAGLQGVEGVRPGLTSHDRRTYRKAAQRYGLYLTGGSDWHGWHEDGPGLFSADPAELRGFFEALQAA